MRLVQLAISWLLYTNLQNKTQCKASLRELKKQNTIQAKRSFEENEKKSA